MSNQPLRLTLRPSLTGAGHRRMDFFDAYLDGDLIVTSRQPLFDGARELKKRGYAPDRLLTMRHHGLDYDSFKPMTIGELARGTVHEGRNGLQLTKYKPMPEHLKRDRAISV